MGSPALISIPASVISNRYEHTALPALPCRRRRSQLRPSGGTHRDEAAAAIAVDPPPRTRLRRCPVRADLKRCAPYKSREGLSAGSAGGGFRGRARRHSRPAAASPRTPVRIGVVSVALW